MKRDFIVEIPIAGSMLIKVKASSEEEAIRLGWKRAEKYTPEDGDFELGWEYMEKVADGNVCYADCNDVTAWEE